MKATLTLLLFLLSLPLLVAQQRLSAGENIYDPDGKGIVYDKELTFGAILMTPRNLGLNVKSGRLETYYRTKYWTFSITDMRHPRESRQSFEAILTTTNRVSRSFIFGKQNQFYALRAGLGVRNYLSEKARQKGVAVGYSYELGPTLGILKPYLLELRYRTDITGAPLLRDVAYSEATADEFLDITRIFGASAWSKGLEDLSIVPGIHGKLATHFGFGAFDQYAKSIEAGVQVDFFFQDVPIMVESELTPGIKNSPLFINLYLNLQLGKRW